MRVSVPFKRDTNTKHKRQSYIKAHLNKASARAGFPTCSAVLAHSCSSASRRRADGTDGTVSEQKHSAARAVAFDPARQARTERPTAANTRRSVTCRDPENGRKASEHPQVQVRAGGREKEF